VTVEGGRTVAGQQSQGPRSSPVGPRRCRRNQAPKCDALASKPITIARTPAPVREDGLADGRRWVPGPHLKMLPIFRPPAPPGGAAAANAGKVPPLPGAAADFATICPGVVKSRLGLVVPAGLETLAGSPPARRGFGERGDESVHDDRRRRGLPPDPSEAYRGCIPGGPGTRILGAAVPQLALTRRPATFRSKLSSPLTSMSPRTPARAVARRAVEEGGPWRCVWPGMSRTRPSGRGRSSLRSGVGGQLSKDSAQASARRGGPLAKVRRSGRLAE